MQVKTVRRKTHENVGAVCACPAEYIQDRADRCAVNAGERQQMGLPVAGWLLGEIRRTFRLGKVPKAEH